MQSEESSPLRMQPWCPWAWAVRERRRGEAGTGSVLRGGGGGGLVCPPHHPTPRLLQALQPLPLLLPSTLRPHCPPLQLPPHHHHHHCHCQRQRTLLQTGR